MIQVSNIERFATHDGPGIRTAVFLKGCSLRCPWCANPETWTAEPVLMHDEERCQHCHTCQRVCPQGAIVWQAEQLHWDASKCVHCGTCVQHCLPMALTLNGQAMEVSELMKELLKDKAYYEESNGGITISGGEPFFQFEAFLQLIKACKENGLHVAVETTGHYPQEQLERAMDKIDLFLFDIKNLDAERFRRVNQGSLKRILKNFEYVTARRPEDVIMRVPVIPGYNDDQLNEIIAYGKQHHVKEIHLLPYHSMGKKKWHQLHRPYAYEDMDMMKPEALKQYEQEGVKIGG